MNIRDLKVGAMCVYFPPKESVDDNRHFPAEVLAVGKRVRVRITSLDEGGG